MTNLALLTLGLTLFAADNEPKVELLWPKGAPGAAGTEERDKPSLTLYLPPADKATGTAVVVCPGGGYGGLAVGHEGKEPAEWLNRHGIAAFVLRYRLGPRYHHPAPLQDAQRALRIVRGRAKEWHLDPKRIGIWGFSAGGHLASTAATHFDDGKRDADDPVERVSCRPDFALIIYPGYLAIAEKNFEFNPDIPVTALTPPAFLLQAEDDSVHVENAVEYFMALKRAGVAAELHTYAQGGHGYGLRPTDKPVTRWPQLAARWLHTIGVLPGTAE